MRRGMILFFMLMFEETAEKFYARLQARGLTPGMVRQFRNTIRQYYKDKSRSDLPWRHTCNPYRILVSEIMLQQTQIERVLRKYPVFIKKYPDFGSLARARVRTLYSVWKGMGYNRRALALKNIACIISAAPYHGRLPADAHDLMRLPFVGQSTAGAVAAFAFGRPAVFIETNIRRVFIHFFFREKKKVSDREILFLIEKTLDGKDPRSWYYALMDYGSALRNLKENPNRKSSRYKKQSPFEGSNRQMRAKILRLISERRNMSVKELAGLVNMPCDKTSEIIDQLCKEGFIKKKGPCVRMG